MSLHLMHLCPSNYTPGSGTVKDVNLGVLIPYTESSMCIWTILFLNTIVKKEAGSLTRNSIMYRYILGEKVKVKKKMYYLINSWIFFFLFLLNKPTKTW